MLKPYLNNQLVMVLKMQIDRNHKMNRLFLSKSDLVDVTEILSDKSRQCYHTKLPGKGLPLISL